MNNEYFLICAMEQIFYLVKDEMFHLSPFCLVEQNKNIFYLLKHLYHYTRKHSLFVYFLTLKWSRPSALPLVVKGGPYGP